MKISYQPNRKCLTRDDIISGRRGEKYDGDAGKDTLGSPYLMQQLSLFTADLTWVSTCTDTLMPLLKMLPYLYSCQSVVSSFVAAPASHVLLFLWPVWLS